MAIKLLALSAVFALAFGIYFITSSGQRNTLNQSEPFVFPCPTGPVADYDSDYSKPFNDANLTSALKELSQCSSLSTVKQLLISFQLGQITTISMFPQLFAKTPQLESLYLSLDYNEIDGNGLLDIKKMFSFTPKLKDLYLSLRYNNIISVEGFTDAFSGISELQQLTLQFSGSALNNIDNLKGILNPLTKLRNVTLSCPFSDITQIPIFNDNYSSMKYLSQVTFLFDHNSLFSDLKSLATQLSSISQPLTLLYLDLSNNNFRDVSALWKGIQGTIVTQQVWINLIKNKISTLTGIENALQKISAINQVSIYLDENSIQDFSNLWTFLSKLNVKYQLAFSLSETQLTDLQGISQALKSSQQVQSLQINLSYNQIVDVSELGKAFQYLQSIKSFQLDLSFNQIDNSVLDLASDIRFQIAENGAFCPFIVDLSVNPFKSDDQTMLALSVEEQQMKKLVKYADCLFPIFLFYY